MTAQEPVRDTAPVGGPNPPADVRAQLGLPAWLRRTVAYCIAALIIAATIWVGVRVLSSIRLAALAAAIALLFAALIGPINDALHRLGLPDWAAAVIGLLVLILIPVAVGALFWNQVSEQIADLGDKLATAWADFRTFFVDELSVPEEWIDRAEQALTDNATAPDVIGGASIVLEGISGLLLALFVAFFLLKDGQRMWNWALGWVPAARRQTVDEAGQVAWWTLRRYALGTIIIALVDAAGIGLALFIMDVPLALSLTLLVFIGSFVPIIGATVSGAAAVLVTLVSQGLTPALIILAVVVAVQQLEGDLLQPMVMGRAVRLHPVTILLALPAGVLLMGFAGAFLAVPIVAAIYRVAVYLRDRTTARTAADQAA